MKNFENYYDLIEYLNEKLVGKTIGFKYFDNDKFIIDNITKIITKYNFSFDIYLKNHFYLCLNIGDGFEIFQCGAILDEKFIEILNLHIKEFMFKEYGVVII